MDIVIGDVALVLRLRCDFRDLRAARDPWDSDAGPIVEAKIARVLGDLLQAEHRLAEEGLFMNSDDELCEIPVEAVA